MGSSNSWLILILIIATTIVAYVAAVPNCPLKCKCNQTSISCTEKQLTAVPDLKKLSWNPIIIDVSENDIEDIKVASFAIKRLELVQELLLDHNSITLIEVNAFASLPSLKYLDLSDNLLDYVSPEIIKKNTKLTELNLSGNRFTSKTPQLISESLQILDLSFSKMSTFTEESLQGLPNLQVLYLEANSLQHVDYNIFVDVKLKYIDLSHNCWKCNCDTIKLFDYLVKAELTEISKPIQCMHPNKWYQDIYSSTGPMHQNKLCKEKHHHRQSSTDSPKSEEEVEVLVKHDSIIAVYIIAAVAGALFMLSVVTLILVCRRTKDSQKHIYEELQNIAIQSKQSGLYLQK